MRQFSTPSAAICDKKRCLITAHANAFDLKYSLLPGVVSRISLQTARTSGVTFAMVLKHPNVTYPRVAHGGAETTAGASGFGV